MLLPSGIATEDSSLLDSTSPSTTMPKRLRVLVSAYFCSPYKGSESGLGWNIVSRMARHHDVTVLCGDLRSEKPTLRDLERYKNESDLPPGLTILHVPPGPDVRLLNQIHQWPGLWFVYYEAYRRWQKAAFRAAERHHREQPFDLVHHLNIIGYREPGYLWQLGIPFFWGPVSGAPVVPSAFLADFSPAQKLRWITRNLINNVQKRGTARCLRAARTAERIWTVSREDREMVCKLWGVEAEAMLETGVKTPDEAVRPLQKQPGEPLRLVWSGIFLGIKALPLVLRALARLPQGTATLDILGDGPEAALWDAEITSLGLAGMVKRHGHQPREAALAMMKQSHVLIHSSVKEGTPHVILEALSMGLPVICHDACGMGIAVSDECGIKVNLIDPTTSIQGFADAIQLLGKNPEMLTKLSEGALRRAHELSWDHIASRIDSAYHGNSIASTQPIGDPA